MLLNRNSYYILNNKKKYLFLNTDTLRNYFKYANLCTRNNYLNNFSRVLHKTVGMCIEYIIYI